MKSSLIFSGFEQSLELIQSKTVKETINYVFKGMFWPKFVLDYPQRSAKCNDIHKVCIKAVLYANILQSLHNLFPSLWAKTVGQINIFVGLLFRNSDYLDKVLKKTN